MCTQLTHPASWTPCQILETVRCCHSGLPSLGLALPGVAFGSKEARDRPVVYAEQASMDDSTDRVTWLRIVSFSSLSEKTMSPLQTIRRSGPGNRMPRIAWNPSNGLTSTGESLRSPGIGRMVHIDFHAWFDAVVLGSRTP